MSPIIFGADLWDRPADYEPPAITHEDPLVMEIAKAILNANPDASGGWEYQLEGATQDSEYYAAPYRATIAAHIAMAVAVREVLP